MTTFNVSEPNLTEYKRLTSISSDYTMTGNEEMLLVDTTSAEVVITLPDLSVSPVDVRKNYIIEHHKGDNNVKIECAGTDTFAYSNTYFNLGTHFFSFVVGTHNNGTTSGWGLVRNTTVKASGLRSTSWASTNFSSTTIIPIESENYNNNAELLVFTSGASAKYTVKTAGSYKISFTIDLDSTGGITWNATAQVYKNGSAIAGTEVRTGNYGSEDQSMALPITYIDLVADDYIDLRIIQSNLTGNLIRASLNIEITL